MRPTENHQIRVRRNAVLPTIGGWLSGRTRPMSAVTIRHTIFVHPDRKLTERLMRHELAHIHQWETYPWTFPLRYAWNHLRHGYRNNPFEIEARHRETTES
jgi:hypothetical protein